LLSAAAAGISIRHYSNVSNVYHHGRAKRETTKAKITSGERNNIPCVCFIYHPERRLM
jgi:hypothetical protein